MEVIAKYNLEDRLENELERLKRKLKLGYELKVRWIPNGCEKLAGEVKGDVIYVYEESQEKALQTLTHEFLDYAISQIVQPYGEVANKLIMLINEETYERKERLVENPVRLIHG